MKLKAFRDLFFLLLIFGGIWYGFSVFSWDVIDEEDLTISTDKEAELTDKFLSEIDADFLENKYIDSVVQIVSSRLVNSMDTNIYAYKFHVVENAEINAFTSFGGHIFINTGLLKFVESAEELSGVLAHELGHAHHRDVITKVSAELGTGILLSVLTGGDPSVLQEISKSVLSSGFSRAMEKEADVFAHDLLIKAKIDPVNLTKFFIRLKGQEKVNVEELEILMSHPDLKNRIDYLSKEAVSEDVEFEEFLIEWDAVLEHLGGE